MERRCPRCAETISPVALMLPKHITQSQCPSCGARIEFSGPLSWGIAIVALLISYGIYSAIQGNLAQLLVMLPIAVALTLVEYFLAPISVTEP